MLVWFIMDIRLGSMFVYFDIFQCFFVEVYVVDLYVLGVFEEFKVCFCVCVLFDFMFYFV